MDERFFGIGRCKHGFNTSDCAHCELATLRERIRVLEARIEQEAGRSLKLMDEAGERDALVEGAIHAGYVDRLRALLNKEK